MSTKAPAVKKALRDLLAAMPKTTADKLQVSLGVPKRIEKKTIYLGETVWESAEWKTNRSREEVFSILVGFSAQIGGIVGEEAEDYVTAMAADFEAALKANPSINGLCITSGFRPKRMDSWPIDQGYQAQFETEVTATCRP